MNPSNSQPTADDIAYAAQRAYIAYGDSVGWASVSGSAMPKWANLGDKIQGAWIAATSTVYAYAQMVAHGEIARVPFLGASVHYQARGSADGAYTRSCRAAVVTEVCTPEYLGTSRISPEDAMRAGVFVMNPDGVYHLNLNGGGSHYDPVTHAGGTWHWAGQCPAP